MATYPPRYSIALASVRSIARQVDCLYLYVNDDGERPPWIRDLPENVRPVLGSKMCGDLQDAGKFWGTRREEDAIYLSCDDDLLYPEDYASHLTGCIEELAGQAACGYHGCIVTEESMKGTYRSAQRYKQHFRKLLSLPQRANVLGTGVMGVDLQAVSISLDEMGERPHADLHVARQLQEQEKACVILPHNERWIKRTPAFESVPHLHEKHLNERAPAWARNYPWTLYQSDESHLHRLA